MMQQQLAWSVERALHCFVVVITVEIVEKCFAEAVRHNLQHGHNINLIDPFEYAIGALSSIGIKTQQL